MPTGSSIGKDGRTSYGLRDKIQTEGSLQQKKKKKKRAEESETRPGTYL